jgi:hypothetical protein
VPVRFLSMRALVVLGNARCSMCMLHAPIAVGMGYIHIRMYAFRAACVRPSA